MEASTKAYQKYKEHHKDNPNELKILLFILTIVSILFIFILLIR